LLFIGAIESMQDVCSEDTGKIRIGGIKLSRELVQYNLYRSAPAPLTLTSFFRQVAEDRINLTFLSLSCSETGSICSFCIAAGDRTRLEGLVASAASAELEVIAPVGTITIFPHHHSLSLLGRVIGILGKAQIPLHALCTSLSSLAINTDYHFLDQAVEELQKVLDLPSNHAPLYQEFDPNALNS
jgi:aspartokinase